MINRALLPCFIRALFFQWNIGKCCEEHASQGVIRLLKKKNQ